MLEVRTRAARSTAHWTASAPIDVVRERLLHEITQSSRARVTTSTSDVIQASVRGNAFSWGERITVRLTPTGNGTSVAVETRPAMPSTLFDWGEGERDIRLLHAAVPGIGSESSEHSLVSGAPARLGRTSRMSKPLGWFVVVVAVLALTLALFNLVVNTERVWSWLPLLVLMSLALVVTVNDLRRR
ncbi:hypothetical protein [Curtobacterium sp. MCBD17_030]|uniref:hypothetical protein n=1 Tax=Curtobacterium sp. MCBD17_030 TaxID=2175649 RepID=UPI0011B36FD3|nr:hypothetical protein [Curtobacterium sp. MCBD17_030]